AYDKALWPLAEQYTPHERITDYTQAIMDLGATVCTRRTPDCTHCPLAASCLAAAWKLQAEIPAPRRRAQRPLRRATLLLIVDDQGRFLLEKRPPGGIWGGLWRLPERPDTHSTEQFCRATLGVP